MSMRQSSYYSEPQLGDRAYLWEVGQRLRSAREQYMAVNPAMTIERFAELLGTSAADYADIECGEAEPGLLLLTRAASTTAADLQWLISGPRLTPRASTGWH